MKKGVLSSMIICGLLSYSASCGEKDNLIFPDYCLPFSARDLMEWSNVRTAFARLSTHSENLPERGYFSFLKEKDWTDEIDPNGDDKDTDWAKKMDTEWGDKIDTVKKSIRRRYQFSKFYNHYFCGGVYGLWNDSE